MGSSGESDSHDEADADGAIDSRRLVESATGHAIIGLDADERIRSWPGPAAALYGYDTEQVLGSPVRRLLADDDRATGTSRTISEADRRTDAGVEGYHERADGTEFWGTMRLSPLSGGGSTGYVAVCRDRTAEKAYERKLERQNDRLKEFTDILAHDLRNPLAVIDGNLTLYEENGDESHLETIRETTDRMASLVDDLLRVAKQGDVVTDPEPTLVQAVADTAWEGVAIDTDATLRSEAVRPLRADPDRLRELFENLFRNAMDHGGDGVTVRLGPLETGFFVEDDGPGIPTALHDTVFDHGFTTASDGSGYGLSVVRSIANAHGWDVVATDADSGGARVEFIGVDFLE